MIWVKLFPHETPEQLARRVAGLLGHDGLDNAPPFANPNGGLWQLDRGNDWWLRSDLDPDGWVRVAYRYASADPKRKVPLVAVVLRELDGRQVEFDAPQAGVPS